MIILQVIFWICVFLIVYSYLFFPVLLQMLSRRAARGRGQQPFDAGMGNGELPLISVIVSAHNEEHVIESKLRSILSGDYPLEKLEVLVGSDASTDRTNQILTDLELADGPIRVIFFEKRTGKPGVVNRLTSEASGEILVITDANVMLDKTTLVELARPFSDPEIGLVDSRMIHTQIQKDGISYQEKFYLSREVRMKYHESLIWGTMMGPFGGCYAVRRSLYRPVPDNYLVDDFYINMAVLQQCYRCITNTDARVFEDISNDQMEEYRRKKRISAGNFQNLSTYSHMLFSRKPGVAVCFFSHKVIRWIAPFLIIATLTSALLLGRHFTCYRVLAMLQIAVLLIPVIDCFLRKFKIHLIPLRFISHFVLMNLALLSGFIRYTGGIKSNVWQPTRRNQVQTEQHRRDPG